MHNELTNLLPVARQHALTRDYLSRLGVMGALLLSALMVASAALLLPTYVLLVKSAGTKEARLAVIESTLVSANEKELSARLAVLTQNATILTELAKAPSASKVISAVLALSRPGITLSSFSYTPATKKGPGTLVISGTAATRDALRNYQITLQATPFALSASLPVSAYAKDANITFAITISLAP